MGDEGLGSIPSPTTGIELETASSSHRVHVEGFEGEKKGCEGKKGKRSAEEKGSSSVQGQGSWKSGSSVLGSWGPTVVVATHRTNARRRIAPLEPPRGGGVQPRTAWMLSESYEVTRRRGGRRVEPRKIHPHAPPP